MDLKPKTHQNNINSDFIGLFAVRVQFSMLSKFASKNLLLTVETICLCKVHSHSCCSWMIHEADSLLLFFVVIRRAIERVRVRFVWVVMLLPYMHIFRLAIAFAHTSFVVLLRVVGFFYSLFLPFVANLNAFMTVCILRDLVMLLPIFRFYAMFMFIVSFIVVVVSVIVDYCVVIICLKHTFIMNICVRAWLTGWLDMFFMPFYSSFSSISFPPSSSSSAAHSILFQCARLLLYFFFVLYPLRHAAKLSRRTKQNNNK